MSISISDYSVYLQNGLNLNRECLKSKESQNANQKVFHRDSLEVSQLSKNREILMNKIKHTMVQSATSFSDMRAGILKEIRQEKGQYDYSDIVNACGLSYARLYSEIEQRHENEQYYKVDGAPLTKEEEIEWLDMQFEQEVEWQKSCSRIAAQGQVFQGKIPEISTKEVEELEDTLYKAKDAYMKLYQENRQVGMPLALQNYMREMVNEFEPDSDYTNVRELTIQNTNEVAWEHYMAMRDISSQTLKDGNYNVEDVMKSIMDTYETRYNEIVKAHENGGREVSYELTGKQSLTLDEDLSGLDEAFKMRLANLEGYITCQQTNKAFENPDSSWYFNRNATQTEEKKQDKVKLFDTEYRDLAVSIMEQAREKFLVAFRRSGYKKGVAISILSDILNENASFGF